ncbi:hypothetical protein [Lentzea sp. NBRC 102530]|uniref:hypothetical protein n=1 Tax=Lentzea sp. NBRC 102530 TaxID=3032201 RepID=UPI0024A34670|nr:hypothetical protein [Lentzea sp. NBRC 102530]GLY50726.1 hypothetical protein Lesp01_43820 [Lentzea sp. NBRC 102530]
MTDMLPPTRDLPPGSHTRIRAELERAAAGRTRRRSLFPVLAGKSRRRLLFPVLAGVASVAAVATSVALLPPAPGPPAPAVQITSTPMDTPKAPDFGVPEETVKAIEKDCGQVAGAGDAKLYQLLDGEVRFALLYSGSAALDCTIGVGGMPYNSGFAGTEVKWLPGHFSVDLSGASAGGDLNLKPIYQGVPGSRTVAGRVDGRVARVTYTIDGRTVEAGIANGTFLVRMYYPSDWQIPNIDDQGVLRFYDAAGTLLGTGADVWKKCYVDPQGKVVQGDRRADPATCVPATPWNPR